MLISQVFFLPWLNYLLIIYILRFFIKMIKGIWSLWHKLWFSSQMSQTYKIFQTMNSVISNNQSLKDKVFTQSGWKAIGIRKFAFVAKTQFLYGNS